MKENKIHCFIEFMMWSDRLKLDSLCVTFRMNDNFARIIDKIFRRKHDFSFVKSLENQIMIFIFDDKNKNSHDNLFETNFRVFAHSFEENFVLYDIDDVVRVWDMCPRGLMMNRRNKREQIASKDREKSLCTWKE